MPRLHVSDLPLIDEHDAGSDVAETFAEIRRVMEIPFVPNIHKAAAGSAHVLSGTWEALRRVFLDTSLPISLASMILFSIAAAKKCQYCSAVHQVTCKTLGVDEESLAALHQNLEELAPERVQVIIKFALKAALEPQALAATDYAAVRAQGITDQELIEIIGLAALGNYLDTLADATKIDVDDVFMQKLRA